MYSKQQQQEDTFKGMPIRITNFMIPMSIFILTTTQRDDILLKLIIPGILQNLQKYTVYRREIISGKEVDVRESSVLSGPNYLELSALQSNRRYDIWVKAETSAGYGASSDITSIILGHTGIIIITQKSWQRSYDKDFQIYKTQKPRPKIIKVFDVKSTTR